GLVYAAVNSYQQVGPVPVRAPLTLTPAPLGDLGAAEPASPVTTQPAPAVTEEPSAEPAAVQRSTVPAPRRPARVPRTVAPATPSQVATASPTPQPTPSPVLTPSGEPTLDTGTPAPEFTVP